MFIIIGHVSAALYWVERVIVNF